MKKYLFALDKSTLRSLKSHRKSSGCFEYLLSLEPVAPFYSFDTASFAAVTVASSFTGTAVNATPTAAAYIAGFLFNSKKMHATTEKKPNTNMHGEHMKRVVYMPTRHSIWQPFQPKPQQNTPLLTQQQQPAHSVQSGLHTISLAQICEVINKMSVLAFGCD